MNTIRNVPSANHISATGLEDVVFRGWSTSVVMTGLEGEEELLRDWGKQSENSRDSVFTGVRLSTSVVSTTERKIK